MALPKQSTDIFRLLGQHLNPEDRAHLRGASAATRESMTTIGKKRLEEQLLQWGDLGFLTSNPDYNDKILSQFNLEMVRFTPEERAAWIAARASLTTPPTVDRSEELVSLLPEYTETLKLPPAEWKKWADKVEARIVPGVRPPGIPEHLPYFPVSTREGVPPSNLSIAAFLEGNFLTILRVLTLDVNRRTPSTLQSRVLEGRALERCQQTNVDSQTRSRNYLLLHLTFRITRLLKSPAAGPFIAVNLSDELLTTPAVIAIFSANGYPFPQGSKVTGVIRRLLDYPSTDTDPERILTVATLILDRLYVEDPQHPEKLIGMFLHVNEKRVVELRRRPLPVPTPIAIPRFFHLDMDALPPLNLAPPTVEPLWREVNYLENEIALHLVGRIPALEPYLRHLLAEYDHWQRTGTLP